MTRASAWKGELIRSACRSWHECKCICHAQPGRARRSPRRPPCTQAKSRSRCRAACSPWWPSAYVARGWVDVARLELSDFCTGSNTAPRDATGVWLAGALLWSAESSPGPKQSYYDGARQKEHAHRGQAGKLWSYYDGTFNRPVSFGEALILSRSCGWQEKVCAHCESSPGSPASG